ncbi:S-antigen protein [Operophtera brumata]|uniref:S-antigen protein n=1 Tax=Operophtera brumata TaxID=104452 RepID=A0A0L7KXP7_OPEBR|nr:S-antigen protein [Operophtera brumata]
MSARNYVSVRDKNYGKLMDSLPSINQQKFGYRSGQELPPVSANNSKLLNRNLNYTYDRNPYLSNNSLHRAGTPMSDFFSDSETEATKKLTEEWSRIERTIYNEDGEKSTRPNILEEIVGKAIQLPEKRTSSFRQIEHDEVIAMHYDNYEQFSESEERLSQSSTDVTPQNSPRPSIASISEDLHEPRLFREKVSFYPTYDDGNLLDSFGSLLQISPIQIHSTPPKKKQNSSILKSEIASSRWMRNSRPDSSRNCDRNSAKSFVSLDTRNYLALSASERNKILNSRVEVTARHRELARLEPLCSPDLLQESTKTQSLNSPFQCHMRKVSLPPLLLEEEKRKVASAKKHNLKSRKRHQPFYQLDKVRH